MSEVTLYRGTSLIRNQDFENGWVFLLRKETFLFLKM